VLIVLEYYLLMNPSFNETQILQAQHSKSVSWISHMRSYVGQKLYVGRIIPQAENNATSRDYGASSRGWSRGIPNRGIEVT